jgi:hypothetical protein
LAALWASFRYRATLGPGFLILAAFSTSYSVLINYSSGVLLLPVSGYLLWTLWQKRHTPRIGLAAGTAVLVGALPLVLLGYYNARCFGSPFLTAYSYYQPPPSIQYGGPAEAYVGGSFLHGLWGFLFSWGRGMFIYTPVLVCAIPGFYLQLKERRYVAETVVLVMTVSLNVLIFAPYRYWFGGHSIGPRHILPAIALVTILMYPCSERMPRWARWVAAVSAAPSAAVHVMLAFLSHDIRALAQSWLETEGYRLGNLYTEILPLFVITDVDIWGNGLFRVMKLILSVIIPVMACWLGWRWRKEQESGV